MTSSADRCAGPADEALGADSSVVIVGAGQAGCQVAFSLRRNGFGGRVTIVGSEAAGPYQRPPLSKAYLGGRAGAEAIRLRAPAFYADNDLDVRIGRTVTGLDRAAGVVELDDGARIAYDHAVLALGARNRTLPVPGAELPGVLGLRTVRDAARMRSAIASASRLVVVGGGFIGLEVAATARAAGVDVTVVEAQPRVLARSVAALTSEFCQDFHAGNGVRFELSSGVSEFAGMHGKVDEVVLADGTRLPADLVVVGVGVAANDELAAAAGVPVDDGVLVDEHLRTSDPRVSAIGDCVRFPSALTGSRLRLESVQNAVDQARCLAARLSGRAAPYRDVPWFWSDQGSLTLQIAGITTGHDRVVVRGDRDAGAFSVFCYRDRQLLGVDSVGRAVDHMAARRILAAGASVDPAEAEDLAFDLKGYSKRLA